jgi:hypothetical protein
LGYPRTGYFCEPVGTAESAAANGQQEMGMYSAFNGAQIPPSYMMYEKVCIGTVSINYGDVSMYQKSVRLAISGVIMFYVVVGGLWATNYFPLRGAYRQQEIARKIEMSTDYETWVENKALQKAREYQDRYYSTHVGSDVTQARINLYQLMLLWGTIALGAGVSVMFLTRGKRAV